MVLKQKIVNNGDMQSYVGSDITKDVAATRNSVLNTDTGNESKALLYADKNGGHLLLSNEDTSLVANTNEILLYKGNSIVDSFVSYNKVIELLRPFVLKFFNPIENDDIVSIYIPYKNAPANFNQMIVTFNINGAVDDYELFSTYGDIFLDRLDENTYAKLAVKSQYYNEFKESISNSGFTGSFTKTLEYVDGAVVGMLFSSENKAFKNSFGNRNLLYKVNYSD